MSSTPLQKSSVMAEHASKPVLLKLHRADKGQRRVLNLRPYNRSTFNDPNRVSLQALSQQLPRRVIELVMP